MRPVTTTDLDRETMATKAIEIGKAYWRAKWSERFDEGIALEVIHDAIMVALESFNGDLSKWETWVRRKIRFAFLDRAKIRTAKHRALATQLSLDCPMKASGQCIQVGGDDERLHLVELEDLSEVASKKLSGRPRKAMLLRLDGMTHKVIGQRLGVSESMVSLYLKQAREILKIHASGPGKVCSSCGLKKPPTDFSDHASRRARRSECKRCAVVRTQKWKLENPEKFQASLDKCRQRNIDHWTEHDPHDNPEPKRCQLCQRLKARSEFNRERRVKDGLKSRCKKCVAAGRKGKRPKRKRKRSSKPTARTIALEKKWAAENPYDNPKPKRCSRCKAIKPRDSFNIRRRSVDGLTCRCKECRAKARREAKG